MSYRCYRCYTSAPEPWLDFMDDCDCEALSHDQRMARRVSNVAARAAGQAGEPGGTDQGG